MINETLTYDEMLKLGEKDFKKHMRTRDSSDREKLLEEMINHEERTHNFRKVLGCQPLLRDDYLVIDVFYKKTSAHLVELFEKIKDIFIKAGKEPVDLVKDAISIKAGADYCNHLNKIPLH